MKIFHRDRARKSFVPTIYYARMPSSTPPQIYPTRELPSGHIRARILRYKFENRIKIPRVNYGKNALGRTRVVAVVVSPTEIRQTR